MFATEIKRISGRKWVENPFHCDLDNQKQTGDLWLNSLTCGASSREAPRQGRFPQRPRPQGQLRRSPPPAGTGTRTRSLSLSSPLRTSSCRSGGLDCPAGSGSSCWWRSPVLSPGPKSNKGRRTPWDWQARLPLELWLLMLWFQRRRNEVWRKEDIYKLCGNYVSTLYVLSYSYKTAPEPKLWFPSALSTPPTSTRLRPRVSYPEGEITQANAFPTLQEGACKPKPNPILESLAIHSISCSTNI